MKEIKIVSTCCIYTVHHQVPTTLLLNLVVCFPFDLKSLWLEVEANSGLLKNKKVSSLLVNSGLRVGKQDVIVNLLWVSTNLILTILAN